MHTISTYHLALATDDGNIVKTNKASLLRHLEANTIPDTSIPTIPNGTTWVVDGMALIQEIGGRISSLLTFGNLAECILGKLVGMATNLFADSIHFVTDQYPSVSIKGGERGKRAAGGTERIKIYSKDQAIPLQWKKYVGCGANKEELVEFLFNTWRQCSPDKFQNVEVFVVHGNLCHSLCAKDGELLVTEVPELHEDHEEADTRLLLHCAYASQRQAPSQYDPQKAVMIRSPDTDVFIIALAFAGVMTSKVLFHTGRGTNVRTIDVTSIKDHLGADVSSALIGLHCLTGCDSVSAFYGKGKIKALKLMYFPN